MAREKIKAPQQKRSIEMRNRILKTGFDLMCEKGYYNTNTAEIAKAAGVSTGIVYRYFNNKKEILLYALQEQCEPVLNELFKKMEIVTSEKDLKYHINDIIRKIADFHIETSVGIRKNISIFKEDEELMQWLKDYEAVICDKLVEKFVDLGYSRKNLFDKIYVAYHLIDSFCDDMILNQNDNLDYDFIISTISQLVNEVLAKDFSLKK